MFAGVVIYVHIVLGFSLFGIFEHLKNKHKKQSTSSASSRLLLSVCSVAYAFSMWLLLRYFIWRTSSLHVWEFFLYTLLIFFFLLLYQSVFN